MDAESLLPVFTTPVTQWGGAEGQRLSTMSDLVAVWDIALSDGVHKVEFEHGTTTGKRVIRVDGEVGVTVSNWLCVCVCVCVL